MELSFVEKLQRARFVALNFEEGLTTMEVVTVNKRRGFACFRYNDGTIFRYNLSELVENGNIKFKGCLLESEAPNPEEVIKKIRRGIRDRDAMCRSVTLVQCRYRSRQSKRLLTRLRCARILTYNDPFLDVHLSTCMVRFRSMGYGPPNTAEVKCATSLLELAASYISIASSVISIDLANLPIKRCLSASDYGSIRKLDQESSIFQMSKEDDATTISLDSLCAVSASAAAMLRPLLYRHNVVYSTLAEALGNSDGDTVPLAEQKSRSLAVDALKPICALFEMASSSNGPSLAFTLRLSESLPSLLGQLRVISNPSFTKDPINASVSDILHGHITQAIQSSLHDIK